VTRFGVLASPEAMDPRNVARQEAFRAADEAAERAKRAEARRERAAAKRRASGGQP
jgi:hypothetical protein